MPANNIRRSQAIESNLINTSANNQRTKDKIFTAGLAMDYYKDFIRDMTKGKQPLGPKTTASHPVVDLVGPKRTTGKIYTALIA